MGKEQKVKELRKQMMKEGMGKSEPIAYSLKNKRHPDKKNPDFFTATRVCTGNRATYRALKKGA